MAKRLHWKELVIGLSSAAVVAAAALLILIFGRVGVLHGHKFTLFATASEVRGVIRGTDVWLDGQKVGMVTGVSFLPPMSNPKERLVMRLSVISAVRHQIRHDTRIQIRSGGTILGDQVIYLEGGTAASAGVVDHDTIHGGEQPDLETGASDATLVAQEFPAIMANVKLLAAQMQSVQGTIGAFGFDQHSRDIKQAFARTKGVLSRVTESHGSVAMTMKSRDELMARAKRSMAQVDSIRALLTSNQTSLGRFRRDSTLMLKIGRVRQDLAEVQRLAASPTGTIGRFRTDSSITRALHRDLVAMDSLFADLKKHPLRYVAF
jgi:ABC-type transporter Mla subunit MlaD